MIKVKNVNPNPHYNCACGNWLKHWEKFGTKKAPHCAAANCTEKATTGAHVQKANSNDENVYVLPLCPNHAQANGELDVWEGYKLVSAIAEQTCDRW